MYRIEFELVNGDVEASSTTTYAETVQELSSMYEFLGCYVEDVRVLQHGRPLPPDEVEEVHAAAFVLLKERVMQPGEVSLKNPDKERPSSWPR